MKMHPLVSYRGVTRSGNSLMGRSAETPEALAQRLYRAGWTKLAVSTHDDDKSQVAGITVRGGRRIWWAESGAGR